jgi:hypothetical protein
MTKYKHTDFRLEANDVKPKQPRTCPVSGKRIYASEGEASSTAVHRLKDKETGPTQLKIYKCLHCNGWHLTKKQL